MSYNITVDVAEDGTATINDDLSYTKTARPGRYVINGHAVPDGEEGFEYVTATDPTGAQATGGHRVTLPKD